MLKNLTLGLTICLAMVFAACSSDDTTNPPTNSGANYLPVKSGNYWIYNVQMIDSVTNDVRGEIAVDSTYYMDSLSFNGKMAYRLVSVNPLDLSQRDTSYYSKGSDGTVYYFVNTSTPELAVLAPDLVPPQKWVPIKPGSESASWTSFDTTYTGVTLDLTSMGLTKIAATVNFKATGTKGLSKSVTINAKNYDAYEYVQNYSIAVNSNTISYVLTQHYLFIDGVGMYQTRSEASSVRFGGNPIMRRDGSTSWLTNFKVN